MKKSLYVLATVFCVLCCTQKAEVADKLEVISGTPLKDFTSAGGDASITLESTAQWTAAVTDPKVSWVSVSPSSGDAGKVQVKISVSRNDLSADRSATVKFTAGKAMTEVAVKQISGEVLSFSLSAAEMEAAGGTLTLQVSSNIDYSVKIDASCTGWIASSDTKAIDINNYHYFISPNRSDNEREGKLIITGKNGDIVAAFKQKGDDGSLPKAEGYVKYSDNSPARGVVVSDGFTCVTTDQNGFYRLYPTADCRHIFISYPSDCKISLNAAGQPDFFKEYIIGQNSYDFSLTKAAVEDEFTLFAMADPQAHFSARGSQKKADTERFRLETVPAVNKVIAGTATPCYGVTLGDVVYSEDSRNSNPGMAIMRDHFKLVNMPVFQTMGNHDFTYFYTSAPLKTDERSSTLYLKAQRAFEDCFGPINYSFNRGSVHVVCMRNIIYDSTTDNLDYHGGFTDEQYQWLLEDLSHVGKDKMVILCVHIPLAYMSGGEHRKDIVSLLAQYSNSTIFSGHTHYARTYTQIQSTYITEHIHQAVCGQWWWSNVEADGCPNGYTVYSIKGTKITNAQLRGVNGPMADPNCQMRIYRGDLKSGGSYGWFQWNHGKGTLLINVFNGHKDQWQLKVYENGKYAGDAVFMANDYYDFDKIEKGKTYDVPDASSQDWWAQAYHIGYLGRGLTGGYYSSCYHMFKYTMKDPSAEVKVVATDIYGNRYECSEITSECYPDYIICEKN